MLKGNKNMAMAKLLDLFLEAPMAATVLHIEIHKEPAQTWLLVGRYLRIPTYLHTANYL